MTERNEYNVFRSMPRPTLYRPDTLRRTEPAAWAALAFALVVGIALGTMLGSLL